MTVRLKLGNRTVKVPKAYHCDGFYYDCPERGKLDVNDNRKRGKERVFCKSKGIYPDKIPCRHCVELKPLFRCKKHKKTGAISVSFSPQNQSPLPITAVRIVDERRKLPDITPLEKMTKGEEARLEKMPFEI